MCVLLFVCLTKFVNLEGGGPVCVCVLFPRFWLCPNLQWAEYALGFAGCLDSFGVFGGMLLFWALPACMMG